MTAEWATVEMLREVLERMETWSQIVFEQVISRGQGHPPGEVLLQSPQTTA
jgi:hypothetical protein